MPKVWGETIDRHRALVREAILDATGDLVEEHGLLTLSMSDIARTAGIGRATLYKYFATVDDVVAAWHERVVRRHVDELKAIASRHGGSSEQLRVVLTAYAHMRSHDEQLAAPAVLHSGEHVASATDEARDLLAGLIAVGARDGVLRKDAPPPELASFCMHALGAAGEVRSTRRLVSLILDAISRE